MLVYLITLLNYKFYRFSFYVDNFRIIYCRHLSISMEMLLNLVRVFGSVIYSTLSAKPSVGVDIEAENRFIILT